jgi:hypothetical protein
MFVICFLFLGMRSVDFLDDCLYCAAVAHLLIVLLFLAIFADDNRYVNDVLVMSNLFVVISGN